MNEIIIKLRKFLMKEKDLIIKANDIDVNSGNDKIDISNIDDCFNFDIETRMYGVRLEGYSDKNTKIYKIYDSLGVVGVDCKDNKIYPLVKLMAYCVYTNNSLIINVKNGKNYVTINMIATLVNRFLEVNSINIKIEVVSKKEREFFIESKVNKMIVISDYEYYLRNKNFMSMESKLFVVEDPIVVVDDMAHIELLNNLDKNILIYTNKALNTNNKEILYDTLDNVIRLVNESKYKHKVIFLTNDESRGKTFVNKCKCENILVNVMDLSTRMPNFDQKDFLYIKTYQTVK